MQFNESHKWSGSLGIVSEIKGDRIMVGVPVPEKGVAYIFCTKRDIEYVGPAVLRFREDNEDEG